MVKKRQGVGGRESGGRGAAVLAGLSFYGWERGTLTVSNLYQVGNEFQFRKSARGHGYRLSGLGEERERRKRERRKPEPLCTQYSVLHKEKEKKKKEKKKKTPGSWRSIVTVKEN